MKVCLHLLFVTLSLAFLASCGFYLKGSEATHRSGINELALVGAYQSSDLGSAIKQQAQINAWSLKEQAAFSINVLTETFEERRLTASQSVSQDEFTLMMTVTFDVYYRTSEHEQTYGPVTVFVDALFQADETRAISKDNEKTRLKRELRQKIAQKMLQQLDLIALSPPICDCEDEDQSPATR